ncbi:serine/threonine protein kinase VPS15, putative (VPS15) [Plasmodium ovale curtisi]|uniref:Serine/threonine protein kinase VPS15, putative (VPS15) n=1 Tax=Plasmodium ovale curtisi TaxID=864141 RepID=A0A1A8VKJ9_PLAOA|nr:serine/threonine protein kinase VPS15, putative (VPS15) [Plasmodium ovale curtisi]
MRGKEGPSPDHNLEYAYASCVQKCNVFPFSRLFNFNYKKNINQSNWKITMGNTLYSNLGQSTTELDEIYCKYLNNLFNIYSYLFKSNLASEREEKRTEKCLNECEAKWCNEELFCDIDLNI